jgi:hypothetical protein
MEYGMKKGAKHLYRANSDNTPVLQYSNPLVIQLGAEPLPTCGEESHGI